VRLSALAPGKLNLTLALGPRREDGLHALVSLVQSLSLADELILGPAEGGEDEVRCPGVAGPNLATAALAAYRAETGWAGVPVRIEIVKRVPVAAGMGGGSGDAAAALRLAAAAAGRPGDPALAALAPGLGADVPAQIRPGLVLVGGAGEELEAVPDRAPFGVLVLPHPAPLSTADVFREADRLGLGRSIEELAAVRVTLREALAGTDALPPAELLVNDLEPAARSLMPGLEPALAAAREAGAEVALVSGSGPTVCGVFPGVEGPALAAAAAVDLLPRFPGAAAAVPVGPGFGDVVGGEEPSAG
jgi:4-diphosphocytidyl-2-C-methyl-D-erythritol kinase